MGIKGIAAASALSMALSMAWAGPALAGEASGPKAEDASKRVCRNVVVSGTRLSTRTCRKKSDWDKDAERAGRQVLDLQTDHSARDGAQTGAMSSGGPPR